MVINKVLIAEDHDSTNFSVQKTLEDLRIDRIDYVYYCDDALAEIKKGKQAGEPYDMLITDLYFEEDYRKQEIRNGMALIEAARKAQPELRVLVFSAERKIAVVEGLYTHQQIDGYVRKARNDTKDLRSAIDNVGHDQRYFPLWYVQQLKHKNAYEFTPYDIALLSFLAQGIRQKEMPEYLKQNSIHPTGLSSIEKRLKQIREALAFSNNEQLIAYCKEMGII